MARIRKINVSQVEGNNDGVLPAGTIAAYEVDGEYVLRVHDGVTAGGVPFPNAPSIDHNNDINITVNSEDSSSYTWNFGQTGALTAPGDIVVGGVNGGHFIIDATEGSNTSVRWFNMPVNENHSIIRAYTGNPDQETELNRGRIQLAWQDSDRSGLRIISYDRSDEENTVEHNWFFRGDGGLVFPDATIQTTAYTGQTGGSGVLYVMANTDGDIVTSTDGVTWGDPRPSGMPGIARVAVHNGVIVYISSGGDGPGQPGLYYSTTIGTVTLCVGTDNIDNNNIFWNQVRYFDEAQQWVAVGYIDGSTNNFPIVAHSTNGISWTLVPADNTFVSGINTTNADWELTDVAYMAETGNFVISSSLNGEGTYGGIFITNNVTVPLDGTVHIAIDLNVDHTAPWSVIGFGGPPGYMVLFGTGDEVWFGYGTDVLDYGSLDGEGPFSWAASITDQIGYLPQVSEIAYDADGFIAVTTGGHVITSSVSFEGPNFIVSIPLPFTSTTFSITNANPAVITFTGESATNNEKIEITLAGEYNGTYYVNSDTGVLYTDQAMTIALDASTFAPFTTGTVTFSHGQYFDAAGTSPSYYYIGNDDEQIFRSSNGLTWTLLADVTGEYFNDFAYGTFGGGSTSTLTNGEYTVTLENNGVVTLPAGGTISEGVVTDNPTIELTPAMPEAVSQKLVIKGGMFEEPTDYHLHLTTGDLTETSIILGTDEHNVRTTIDGGVEINTRDYDNTASNTWRFSSSGEIYLPASDPDNFFSGQIYAGGDSGGFLNLNIQGMASEEDYGGVRLGNSNNKPVELWAGINTIFKFDSDGSLTLPGDIKSESAINIDINLSDSTLRRWTFGEDGDLTLPAGGDIKNSSGTSVLSAVQGEYIYEFDGINTNLTITDLNFNLLYCDPVDGYLGSDTHNVNLPAGTPGQRLVVVNISSNCTLTVNGFKQVTALSGPAEFIYSPTDDSWITLYGTV